MNPAKSLGLTVLVLALMGCGSAAPPARDIRAIADEIRARSLAFAAAESAKELEASLAFWLPEAELHKEGVPPIIGHAALRTMYEQFFPALESLEAKSSRIVVQACGDIAYQTATLFLTFKSRSGPVKSTAKSLLVWKLGPGGKWQIAAGSVTGNPGAAADSSEP